eukprot:196704_1
MYTYWITTIILLHSIFPINSIHQSEPTSIKKKKESDIDLIQFLDEFYKTHPLVCRQLRFIRIVCAADNFVDMEDYLINSELKENKYKQIKHKLSNYVASILPSAVKKYANLKYFISCKSELDFSDYAIYPSDIEYVANQSNDLCVIDVDNMAPDIRNSRHNNAFKTLFNKHHNLRVIRIRNDQCCQYSTSPTISPTDFNVAVLDKLQVLMIENNWAFRWNRLFLNILAKKLNIDIFAYLYLTMDGMSINGNMLASGGVWTQFESQFTNCIIQNKKYHWSEILNQKHQKSVDLAGRNT